MKYMIMIAAMKQYMLKMTLKNFLENVEKYGIGLLN